VRYFLHDFTRPVTDSELAIDNPYNTYVHSGLPPTPIGDPGLQAMAAAVDPARVSYLYYVNKPYTCGGLAFATTYAHFLAEKAAYDAARAKNGYREPARCP
jgi:cell division protein YceG involved in septum cleavage